MCQWQHLHVLDTSNTAAGCSYRSQSPVTWPLYGNVNSCSPDKKLLTHTCQKSIRSHNTYGIRIINFLIKVRNVILFPILAVHSNLIIFMHAQYITCHHIE